MANAKAKVNKTASVIEIDIKSDFNKNLILL